MPEQEPRMEDLDVEQLLVMIELLHLYEYDGGDVEELQEQANRALEDKLND